MAGYRRDGTFYIKNRVGIDVPSDGTRKGLFGKAIPPYVVVDKAWVHIWALGTNGVPMNAKQELQISGRMGNMDLDIDAESTGTSHDTLEEIMARYIPTDTNQEWLDDDQADVEGAGLGAGANGPMSKWAKDREWYDYQCMMGLGRNAMMTQSNTLRFVAENSTGSRGKKISGYGCNVQQFRYIGIDVSSEVYSSDINQDVEKHVWGATTAAPKELSQQAFYAFGHQGQGDERSHFVASQNTSFETATGSVDGTNLGIDPYHSFASPYGGYNAVGLTLYDWMSTGYGHGDHTLDMDASDDTGGSGFDDGTPINVQGSITLRCKTIKPRQSNIYTPY